MGFKIFTRRSDVEGQPYFKRLATCKQLQRSFKIIGNYYSMGYTGHHFILICSLATTSLNLASQLKWCLLSRMSVFGD